MLAYWKALFEFKLSLSSHQTTGAWLAGNATASPKQTRIWLYLSRPPSNGCLLSSQECDYILFYWPEHYKLELWTTHHTWTTHNNLDKELTATCKVQSVQDQTYSPYSLPFRQKINEKRAAVFQVLNTYCDGRSIEQLLIFWPSFLFLVQVMFFPFKESQPCRPWFLSLQSSSITFVYWTLNK